MRFTTGLTYLIAGSLLAGCQPAAGVPTSPSSGSQPATTPAIATPATAAAQPSTGTAPGSPSAAQPSPSSTSASKKLAGTVIVIDPGHNGVWTRKLLRKVPSGNGRTKACNSSGTATNSGYAEHAYNWAQANALARVLRARGATVELTRNNDTGQGPCINLRARAANTAKADFLISIHADGNLTRGTRGFHIITSSTMLGGATVERRSVALAKRLRRELEAQTEMPRSNYIGGGSGLNSRDDLGTLNLSERPGVMLEMGNMRNATDAKLLASKAFRAQVAQALADGVQASLNS